MDQTEWALACAARGWLVFPSKSKRPLVKWGTQTTTDPDKIRQWWSQWPDADVCIKTGAESGIVVVDWDAYKTNSLEWPLEPKPPATYTTQTLKGGLHFYYRHPGYPVSNSAGVVAPDVDVRGDGGMVVAYRPISDVPLADAPPAWLARRERTVDHAATLTPPHDPKDDPAGLYLTTLRSAVSSVRWAEDGRRNQTLYAVASDIYLALCWEGPVRMECVTQSLGDAAHDAGLEPGEIAATLLSAQRNAASRQGQGDS